MLSDQVGAHADLLNPSSGGNGVLVKGPSVEELEAGVRQMVEKSDDELAEMGRSSQRIIQDWKYEQSVGNFVEMCEQSGPRKQNR